MKLKKIFMINTNVLLYTATILCSSTLCSFTYAQDYISTSQINAANGIAGLNSSKKVTSDIDNARIDSDYVQLKEAGKRLRFITYGDSKGSGSSNGNDNHWIDLFYNKKDSKITDENGKILDNDTFYFTNNKYGNRFKFNGSVVANKFDADTLAGASVNIGKESLSPYNTDSNSPLVFLSQWGYDNGNIKPNTLMIGGNTRNSIVGIKATCQNTGGGDLGGSCYQFTNMSGRQTNHRGGAGFTDGINMDIRNTDNSPIDAIGGNTLVQNEDGTYSVKGNDYSVTNAVTAGVSTFKVNGTFGCGIGDGQSRCEMTGIDVLDTDGQVVNTVKVTPGTYDAVNNTTSVILPNNYKTKDNLTTSNSVNIKFYSADGIAYGVGFDTYVDPNDKDKNVQHVAIVSPALSTNEANLIGPRMAIWTNISDGMASTEGGDNEDGYNVDMPNYYYGYNAWNASDTKLNITRIAIQTSYYPNTAASKFGWRTALNSNDGNSENPRFSLLSKWDKSGNQSIVENSDGKNNSTQYDYKLDYTYPGTANIRHNSNYHRYSQPTLFLGLNKTSFNLYTDQVYQHAPDSITRVFGNEMDFVMPTKGRGAVSSKGLTLTWSDNGGAETNYAKGSYMMRLHGGRQMPMGLWVDGVWPYNGKAIQTDAGFSVFNNSANPSDKDYLLTNVNDAMTISTLGQGYARQYGSAQSGGSYQLLNYLSNDGTNNYSLHLGMTYRENSGLQLNTSPTCNGDKSCSVLGQVIFNPLGYIGGIALGSGQGENTKLGLIVDAASNVIVKNKLTVSGKSINDFIDNAVTKSQINTANGVAGLNETKQVTADINSKNINAEGITGNYLRGNMLNINPPSTSTDLHPIRFNSSVGYGVDLFYNSTAMIDGWGNSLDANTLYFSNHHGSGNYKFDGMLKANNMSTNNMTINTSISSPKFIGTLSTPASSQASCNAGEFKDDANYHYVCVAPNKWKRVALSDF